MVDRRWDKWLAFFVLGGFFTLAPSCAGVAVLFPVWLTFLLLAVGMIPWRAACRWCRGQTPPTDPVPRFSPAYLCFSLAAVPAAFAWPAYSALGYQAKMDALRAEYPYESMENRLPVRPLATPVGADAGRSLEAAEGGMKGDGGRSHLLHALHEGQITRFVNSPGFGVTRMHAHFAPDRESLQYRQRDDAAVGQPSYQEPAAPWEAQTATEEHARAHRGSLLDFSYPEGWGYLKDRGRVAGFRPHGFSKPPAPPVRRVDLIGLLRHPTPVAYV
ncbi:MAG: hypothetical protein ACRC33_22885, partial [Gemmataceae bacterium]